MNKILSTIILVSFSFWSYSQCTVTIDTASDSLDCGECFDLTAVGLAQQVLMSENFNNNQLGPGWTTNQTVMFNNPCGAPPDGSPSAWFGNQQTQPRILETIDYDMTCGGDICFMMKYAAQGGSGSCEGPDAANEGVKFQYSINGGATWVMIFDHAPLNNGTNPYQTSWNQYCYPVPLAAQTTSTRFRWYQQLGSGSGFDHWGIDDVEVLGTICGTYYYDWFADGTIDQPDTNFCMSQNVQTYNVIFTDGISDTCHASIDMYGVLYPNLPNDTSFCGFIDHDLVSNPTGGSGNYTYLWNNGDTDNTIENATTNIYYIDIQDQTYPGCTASDTINFEMYPNPDVNFDAFPLCQGNLTNFTDLTDLPPGYNVGTWFWNFNNQGATSTDQNPSHLFSGVGTYNVKLSVVTQDGCVGDTTITFFVGPSPYADFTYTPACEGEEVLFTNKSIGNYENSQWTFTNSTDTIYSTDAAYTFPGDGPYDVTLYIEDVNGDCTSTSTQTIIVKSAPDASFLASPLYGNPVLDVTFYTDLSNLVDSYWDFGDGNNSSLFSDTVYNSFVDPGVYTVVHTGTGLNGCPGRFEVNIIVEYPEVQVRIPNIITPNNDGVNDGFFITFSQAVETISDFEIVFLNRWGNIIQSYNEPDFVWDGKSKSGNELNDGTYFYKVTFKDLKGQRYAEHGFVQVVNN